MIRPQSSSRGVMSEIANGDETGRPEPLGKHLLPGGALLLARSGLSPAGTVLAFPDALVSYDTLKKIAGRYAATGETWRGLL
jgi:hypothetical protein